MSTVEYTEELTNAELAAEDLVDAHDVLTALERFGSDFRQGRLALLDQKLPNPANYNFLTDEIRVNPIKVGAGPEKRAILKGFLSHELGHAHWSTWRLDVADGSYKIKKAVFETINILDEIRIERRAFDAGYGKYLRKSFSRILEMELEALSSPDFKPTRLGLSYLWALCYGRYLASIASKEDVAPIDALVRAQLGDDTVDAMVEILSEFTAVNTLLAMDRLGAEWNELLHDDDEDGAGEGGKGEPCDGEGDAEGEGGGDATEGDAAETHPGPGKDKGEKSDEDGDGSDGDDADGEGKDGEPKGARKPGHGYADGGGGGDTATERNKATEKDNVGGTEGAAPLTDGHEVDKGFVWDEELTELLANALTGLADKAITTPIPRNRTVELADAGKQAQKIFTMPRDELVKKYREIEPDTKIIGMAKAFTREFENIVVPRIDKTHVASEVPPGRMRSREALRKSADKAMGRMSKARPWEGTKKTRTAGKPVTVGIMTDVSGSMGWAEGFVARFTYVVGTASVRVGARAAAVTFGDAVIQTLKPGETPHLLRRVPANGGHEEFDHAFAALDGVLSLTKENNVHKLLFIVSDGHFVKGGEDERALEWIRRAQEAGTTVVWIENQNGIYRDAKDIVHIRAKGGEGDMETRVFGAMAKEITKAMRGVLRNVAR